LLEPRVPPLESRLGQLEALSRRFGPQSIHWRFDPLCFYRKTGGSVENNLADFSVIARSAHRAGVTRCITSFMDHYPKIQRRLAAVPGFSFVDPSPVEKAAILLKLETRLRPLQIDLSTCCEKTILQRLPAETKIRPSACISNTLLTELYGGRISLKRDTGQRRRQGCGCQVSVDVGSYGDQPCSHGCLFCYANPRGGATLSTPGESRSLRHSAVPK
jgi:DNA repair photolyase